MRKFILFSAVFAAFAGLGLAETWQGTLLDANCMHRHSTKACDAKPYTTSFLLDVNGTQYKLDYGSNYGANTAMEERADKTSNPYATKAVPVTATVTGYLKGNGKIHAKTIQVQD